MNEINRDGGIKGMGRSSKWNSESINEWLLERGCNLLTENVKSGEEKIQYVCGECKEIHEYRFYQLLQRPNVCNKHDRERTQTKYTREDVDSWLSNQGGVLITEEYKNASQKLEYRCGSCEQKHSMSFSRMLEKGMCNKGVRLSEDEIRQRLEHVGKTYIEEVEKDEYGKRQFKCYCVCGRITVDRLHVLEQNKGCTGCFGSRVKIPFDKVREDFDALDLELDAEESDYQNIFSKLKCRCRKCGFVGTTSYDAVRGRYNRKGSRPCNCGTPSGSEHYAWNPNMTDEDRKVRRRIEGYSQWRYAIYKKYKNTCMCCGETNLKGKNRQAHHLYNYGTYKETRLDISNGALLCMPCHNKFHSIYGRNDNQPWQLEEFLRNYGSKCDVNGVNKEADRDTHNTL